MKRRDPRVDRYIEDAAEFAQPILRHLRDVVRAASPEIEETMKWSFPHFTYRGILCSMAAFKEHCALGFWKESLILPRGEGREKEGMGQFGRITSLADLPSREVLIGYVRAAMRLNEQGVQAPRSASSRAAEVAMPAEFRQALDRHAPAAATFERFSPSHRREYVEWIAEAKRDETRARRIATAIAWLSEGKSRNWKYTRSGS